MSPANENAIRAACRRCTEEIQQAMRKNKWHASIRVKGKRIHLGYFKTAKEAYDKYVEASKKYHSQYTRAQPLSGSDRSDHHKAS